MQNTVVPHQNLLPETGQFQTGATEHLVPVETHVARWNNCVNDIRSQIPTDEFDTWFRPVAALEYRDNILRLRVPDTTFVHRIEKQYIPLLRPLIDRHFGPQTRLHYAVPKSTQPVAAIVESKTNSTNIPKNPFESAPKRIIIDPQLNPAYTFETFIEGECNRLARSAGSAVANEPGTTPFNPLYIYGGSGLGKTHLVQAIGHEVRAKHPELQVLYVSMNRFQAQFQTAFKNGDIPDFIHFYQMIDVLIIDDIQELTGKTGTQNAFFNIFNHLQLAGKQLILTSDKPPVELRDIEQRLLTRFKWGLSTELSKPDFDTKTAIIRAKSARLSVTLPDDVVAFMAENIADNVREIEGTLASLVAHARLLGRHVDISLAKELLRAYVKENRREVTIEQIISVVCQRFKIESERFNSAERTRDVAIARQIAMFLAKKYTKTSLSAIGSAIGGRNHATVLHACKTVQNQIDTDKNFRSQIEELERSLK